MGESGPVPSFQRLLPFAFHAHSMEGRGRVKGSLRRANTARPLHRPGLPTNPTEKKAKGRSSHREPVTPALNPTGFYTLGIHSADQEWPTPRALD